MARGKGGPLGFGILSGNHFGSGTSKQTMDVSVSQDIDTAIDMVLSAHDQTQLTVMRDRAIQYLQSQANIKTNVINAEIDMLSRQAAGMMDQRTFDQRMVELNVKRKAIANQLQVGQQAIDTVANAKSAAFQYP